jgi:hypothetical protein
MDPVAMSEDGRYVIVRMPGEVSATRAAGLMAHTIALAEQAPADEFRGFLIDVRGARNTSSAEANYLFTREDFAEHPIIGRSRLAVLVDVFDHTHDFVESAARRGGYAVRITWLTDEAIDWIENGREPLA